MDKKTEALKLAEDALKRVRTQDMELVQLSMIALAAIREALAEQPAPPPECQTEAEKTAYAFGWFKALESVRKRPAEQEPMTTQTEADRLANQLDYHREYDLGVTHTGIDEQAAAELRRQQAEIERLNEALAEQPAPMIRGDIRDGLVDDEPAQQQEPVAYIHRQGNHWEVSERFLCDGEKARGWTEEPLYTSSPAQRPWVGLTDDEILYCVELENPKAIAEEVEAKLREKNT